MRRNYHLLILLFPVVFWLICFFLLPLVSVFIYSFIERGTYGGVWWNFTLENYQRLLDGLYLGILWRSVSTALLCTTICLLLGYPFAYYLARYRPKHRNVLLLLVVVPFWTNFPFLTPDLLGGGKVSYIGNVIERQFKTARDWPFGSALSFMLMGIVLVGTVLYFRALQDSESAES